jgi:rhamnosyltransferase
MSKELSINSKLVSVVIRTLNESAYLSELLEALVTQKLSDLQLEIVLIDSGSVDATVEIARSFGCRITHIEKTRFSFGRSLNEGCSFARGCILVMISGHCIPTDEYWLENLIAPIVAGDANYTYGRQLGRFPTKFSEGQLFRKYFPSVSRIPQEGYFVNNANSAIARGAWQKLKFNEELTGLEDMDLAKRLIRSGGKVGYCADACVFHIHDERWKQTQLRYEREALALQTIMPEVHVSIGDVARYIAAGIFNDVLEAFRQRVLMREALSIIKFRIAQFTGTYRGNRQHRSISRKKKESYFYPRATE